MEVAVLTPLADDASAIVQDYACRPLVLPKHGQVACTCDSLEHSHAHMRSSSMLSVLQLGGLNLDIHRRWMDKPPILIKIID